MIAAKSQRPPHPNPIPVEPACIPDELKKGKRFVLWAYENQNGRVVKPPLQPNGRYAKVDDPTTWVTFEQAENALLADPDRFDGIGIVMTCDDKLIGIDLDKCVDEDGNLQQAATEIVDSLGSYSEYSPSGTGVRSFVFADGDFPARVGQIDSVKTEIYSDRHYLTLTGSRLPKSSSEICERTQALNKIRAMVVTVSNQSGRSRSRSKSASVTETQLRRDLLSIIEGDQRLRAAWNMERPSPSQTDTSPSGFGFSLISMLAWKGVGESDLIIALKAFRQRHGVNNKSEQWFRTEIRKTVELVTAARASVRPNAERWTELARQHGQLVGGGRKSHLRLLLIELAAFAGSDGHAFPSQKRLAEILGCRPEAVSRSLAALAELGCIKLVKRSSPGKNNLYKLNCDDETHHRLRFSTTITTPTLALDDNRNQSNG